MCRWTGEVDIGMTRSKERVDDLVWRCGKKESLETFLKGKGISHNAFMDLYREGLVRVDGKKAGRNTKLEGNEEVRISIPKEDVDYEAIPMNLTVLYEDMDLLILDKPAGITVNSTGQISLANGVAAYFKANKIRRKIRFVNRLDMGTSGCIVIAKHGIAQHYYQKQMEEGVFEKWYEALVEGKITGEGEINVPMKRGENGISYIVTENGKMTRTAYRAIRQENEETLVEVRLFTGKTHQIRVAMAHIGHPLVGDILYGGNERKGGFSLRAKRIVFLSMRTRERIILEC